MSGRLFHIDGWEGSEDPVSEEAKTFCRLHVFRDAHSPASRILDKRADTTRDFLYASAYPLAEWLASNYWTLTAIEGQVRKVNLIEGGGGYLLPDLRWRCLGPMVEMKWKGRDLPDQPIDFLGHGQAMLSLADVEREISRFVDRVLDRLGAGEGEALRQEWASVCATRANLDEAVWCRIVASLGLDPYSLDDEARRAIETAARNLPDRDLILQLAPACRSLEEFVSRASRANDLVNAATSGKAPGLVAVKEDLPRLGKDQKYYERGYELARQFRAATSSPSTFESYQGFRKWVEDLAESEDWISEGQPDSVIYGAMSAKPATGPGIALARTDKTERMMFGLARGVGEFLDSRGTVKSILSAVDTVTARVGRAFAAELLAPSDFIRETLSSSEVSDEEISAIADHFGVEDLVIRHQIKNHRLAELVN
jgi:hypothetical protein